MLDFSASCRHRAELAHMIAGAPRNVRRLALKQVARKLSAPLYGKLVTTADAKRILTMPSLTSRVAK
jgi:hypothetical protein